MRLLMLGSGLFLLALFVGLGTAFMQRRIGPNPITGIRIPETMNDPDLWYAAHEYGGRLMVWAGLTIGLITLALYFIPSIGDEFYALAISAAIILVLSLWSWKALSYTKALARAKHAETETDKDWYASLRVLGLVIAIFASVLIIVPSIPLALGQVSPNPTYGFRIPETLSNSSIWYKANAYAGWLQISAGGFTLMLAVGLYFIRRVSLVVYLLISLLVTGLSPIVVSVFSIAYVHSLVGR